METKRQMRVQHVFNGDYGKGAKSGPLLIIEVIFNPNGPDTGALIAHKWVGSGEATKEEISQLTEHYRKNDWKMLADYLDVALK